MAKKKKSADSAASQTKKAAKKAESSTTSSKSTPAESTAKGTSQKTGKQVKITKTKLLKFLGLVVIIIVTVVLVDFVVQYINNDYSVAIVNGERIPRSEYEETLEDTYGSVIATQVINEAIIMQEAEKEGVEINEEDIDEMIDKTKEELGGDEAYKEALESNGITEETFRERLRLQKIAEELVIEEPSEDDLKAFFEEYQEVYWTADDTYDDVKDDIRDVYVNQKFNEESAVWLAELTSEADIQNNVSDEPKYGILVITRGFFSDLNDRLE